MKQKNNSYLQLYVITAPSFARRNEPLKVRVQMPVVACSTSPDPLITSISTRTSSVSATAASVSTTTGKESGALAAEPSVLDGSTLKPDESLAGRNFSGWTLKGDFSERNFACARLDGANLRRVVARHANFRDASMRGADASRADLRGACLVGVAVHGARLRRANCESARMAGMWGAPECDKKPEVKPLEDGTMPPMEPLARTEQLGQRWDKEEAEPGDRFTAEEAKEDSDDNAALEAHTHLLDMSFGGSEAGDTSKHADVVDMQHMNAT